MTVAPVRLRQVALVTSDLAATDEALREQLGLGEGFVDDGVGYFGLENRVLAVGDCFVEVLTPLRADTAGQRHLDRQGGDAGYMAIFQLADRSWPRARAAELGIRVVWQGDLDDISGTHLDPRDVPGAIVSLDWADPPQTWHWAGPAWRGTVPAGVRPGIGLASLEVAVAFADPEVVAARWASVLGVTPVGAEVPLSEAGQVLRFRPVGPDGRSGVVACAILAAAVPRRRSDEPFEAGGIVFSIV